MIEYVSHLHEHFEDPVNVKSGVYHLPQVSKCIIYSVFSKKQWDTLRYDVLQCLYDLVCNVTGIRK